MMIEPGGATEAAKYPTPTKESTELTQLFLTLFAKEFANWNEAFKFVRPEIGSANLVEMRLKTYGSSFKDQEGNIREYDCLNLYATTLRPYNWFKDHGHYNIVVRNGKKYVGDWDNAECIRLEFTKEQVTTLAELSENWDRFQTDKQLKENLRRGYSVMSRIVEAGEL
jgi:hypothetical protein